jgi:hypothetical protein
MAEELPCDDLRHIPIVLVLERVDDANWRRFQGVTGTGGIRCALGSARQRSAQPVEGYGHQSPLLDILRLIRSLALPTSPSATRSLSASSSLLINPSVCTMMFVYARKLGPGGKIFDRRRLP